MCQTTTCFKNKHSSVTTDALYHIASAFIFFLLQKATVSQSLSTFFLQEFRLFISAFVKRLPSRLLNCSAWLPLWRKPWKALCFYNFNYQNCFFNTAQNIKWTTLKLSILFERFYFDCLPLNLLLNLDIMHSCKTICTLHHSSLWRFERLQAILNVVAHMSHSHHQWCFRATAALRARGLVGWTPANTVDCPLCLCAVARNFTQRFGVIWTQCFLGSGWESFGSIMKGNTASV